MNHRHLLHAGCLLAASLVFSGCVADKQVSSSQTGASKPRPTFASSSSSANKQITPVKDVAVQAAAPKKQAAAQASKPTVAQLASAASGSKNLLDRYRVKLSTNKDSVKAGEPLSLHVTIEAPQYPLSGKEAHGFQVSLKGTGFTAEQPAPECLRGHPSGSEVIYILHSASPGTFDVSADVSVFPTRDCAASNVQKTSKAVKISVAD